MAFMAGRLGSMSVDSLTWEGAIQNWRLSESVELPDTTVLGDTADSHVIGIITNTVTAEVLFDDADTIVEIEPGTAITLVELLLGSGTEVISGPGTLQSVSFRTDRRGAQVMTIVIKSKGAWTWAES